MKSRSLFVLMVAMVVAGSYPVLAEIQRGPMPERLRGKINRIPPKHRVEMALENFEHFLSRATQLVSSSENSDAEALLNRAGELKMEAESLINSGQFREGLRVLLQARRLLHDVIILAEGRVSLADRARERIELAKGELTEMLDLAAKTGDQRLIKLAQRMQSALEDASAAMEAGEYHKALQIVMHVRPMLMRVHHRMRDDLPLEERIGHILEKTRGLIERAEGIVADDPDEQAEALLVKASSAFDEADSLVQAGQYREALELLGQARRYALGAIRIVKGLPDPDQMALRLLHRAEESVEQVRTALAEGDDQRFERLPNRLEQMLEKAEEAFEAGDYRGAIELARRVMRVSTRILHVHHHGAPKGLEEAHNPSAPNFGLYQNHPNPFNPSTEISYSIPEEARVTLTIYNILGQEVRRLVDGIQGPGSYTVGWDGKDESGNHVSSGIYLYRLTSGNHSQTRKMFLAR